MDSSFPSSNCKCGIYGPLNVGLKLKPGFPNTFTKCSLCSNISELLPEYLAYSEHSINIKVYYLK